MNHMAGQKHASTSHDLRLHWIRDHHELGARVEVDAGDVVEVRHRSGSDDAIAHLDQGVVLDGARGRRVLRTARRTRSDRHRGTASTRKQRGEERLTAREGKNTRRSRSRYHSNPGTRYFDTCTSIRPT